MFKKVLLAGVLSVALGGTAFAADPTDGPGCQALVKSTFEAFGGKKMDDATAKSVEAKLEELAGLCADAKYAEAAKAADDIMAMVPKG